MPLALLGVSAAASLAGTGLSIAGNSESQSAMNKARAKLLDSGVDVAIVRNQR